MIPQRICDSIKTEASLSFRLLRYLNSPLFPLASEVRSIPHAVSLLGETGTRKWVSLMTVACLSDDKPRELILLPLIRARFCELLAAPARCPAAANDLFLLGLLSAMDAVLDMSLTDILQEINVREEIRDALLGAANQLHDVFSLAVNYERGRWEEVKTAARHVHRRRFGRTALFRRGQLGRMYAPGSLKLIPNRARSDRQSLDRVAVRR
jgi:EAL and modified HD-GYP domain-containing signal transduction protein